MDNLQDSFSAQLRYRVHHHGFETYEEAFFDCPECGPIEPYYVNLSGRYLKGHCACTIRRRMEREQAEIRMAWMRDQFRKNYEWMGQQWSDMSLCDKTFDNFDESLQPDAWREVQFFLQERNGNLILHSMGFGTGKTHLLAAMVNCLRVNGIASRFATAPKLFRAIQERIDHKEEYTPFIHIATHTPLLVLDDVDKAKPSDWKQELYFEIIDERVKRGLPIAISTNRVSDLAFYVGGAACSRLSISQIDVDMNGLDYRTRL